MRVFFLMFGFLHAILATLAGLLIILHQKDVARDFLWIHAVIASGTLVLCGVSSIKAYARYCFFLLGMGFWAIAWDVFCIGFVWAVASLRLAPFGIISLSFFAISYSVLVVESKKVPRLWQEALRSSRIDFSKGILDLSVHPKSNEKMHSWEWWWRLAPLSVFAALLASRLDTDGKFVLMISAILALFLTVLFVALGWMLGFGFLYRLLIEERRYGIILKVVRDDGIKSRFSPTEDGKE